MSTALLTCVGVNKSYGGVQAVKDVAISVAAGEIVGLVGPNGAGKTTLVDVITGQQQADTGDIRISGTRLTGPPSVRARRAGFARTFQHPQLALDMTIRENLLIGAVGGSMGRLPGVLRRVATGMFVPTAGADEQRVRDVAADFGLTGLHRLVADLTLGEQRLVEVARAMLRVPQVLLLDEPFAGGDLRGVGAMTRGLERVLDRGCGVLLVDHNIDIVAGLVHRMVLMDQGAVVFEGPPDVALASQEMRDVYFGGHSA
ncbi:ABC transporter ATP-binding protein [Nocardioides dongkuii]|uniref:ABC transporter ATP-binding protein n=1 Tax=Nocardioides dongkuii TaxID=2760089 RepID=UPI001C704815|nr:ATP-binding cassette domain-containing protein [Nocardioides dongkuii]